MSFHWPIDEMWLCCSWIESDIHIHSSDFSICELNIASLSNISFSAAGYTMGKNSNFNSNFWIFEKNSADYNSLVAWSTRWRTNFSWKYFKSITIYFWNDVKMEVDRKLVIVANGDLTVFQVPFNILDTFNKCCFYLS